MIKLKKYLEQGDNFYTKLEDIRWSSGFKCPNPKCIQYRKRGDYWVVNSPRAYKCLKCLRKTSVYCGSLMNRSHVPPAIWIKAIEIFIKYKFQLKVMSLKNGLQLKYYDTAKVLYNKINKKYLLKKKIIDFKMSRLGGKDFKSIAREILFEP